MHPLLELGARLLLGHLPAQLVAQARDIVRVDRFLQLSQGCVADPSCARLLPSLVRHFVLHLRVFFWCTPTALLQIFLCVDPGLLLLVILRLLAALVRAPCCRHGGSRNRCRHSCCIFELLGSALDLLHQVRPDPFLELRHHIVDRAVRCRPLLQLLSKLRLCVVRVAREDVGEAVLDPADN